MTPAASPYRKQEASSYDRDREIERHWHLEIDHVREVMRRLAPRSVLDIPIGTGRVLPAFGDAHVVGVDLSMDMLREAAARRDAEGVGLLLASVERLPLPDREFDLTLCCRLLHLLDPSLLAPAIAEMARVTRDTLVLQSYFRGSLVARGWYALQRRVSRRVKRPVAPEQAWAHIPSHRHPQDQVFDAVRATGFELARTDTICHYRGERVVFSEWRRRG